MNFHLLATASLMLLSVSGGVAAEEPNLRGVADNFKEQVAEAIEEKTNGYPESLWYGIDIDPSNIPTCNHNSDCDHECCDGTCCPSDYPHCADDSSRPGRCKRD